MIGLDTNILIRFLANDDPVQSPRAMELLRSLNEENPGFQSLVVLAEMVWVLRRRFRASRQDVVRYVEIMLNSNGLVIENSLVVRQALLRFEGGEADFADYLIERSCHSAGCANTLTFDVDAARDAGMNLL